jgi:hypothetical protein
LLDEGLVMLFHRLPAAKNTAYERHVFKCHCASFICKLYL